MLSASAEIFRSEVQQYLSVLDLSLVDVLRALIEYDYPAEVFALSFEVFSDSFTSQFPARVFFVDRNNTEFFLYTEGEAQYPSPIAPELLEIDGIYPDEIEEALEALDPHADAWQIATQEFITWFAKCWGVAGGASFPLVATIVSHDSEQEFNLVQERWQSSYAAFSF
jgi:hypothetical protein